MVARAADSLARLSGEFAAQENRWTLWSPVAFGLGAAGYMTLKVEPPFWLALAVAGIAAAGAWAPRRRFGTGGAVVAATLLAFAATGFFAAKLRADRVAAPIAPAADSPRVIEAWVVDVPSPGAGGPRMLLAPVWISGLSPEETPVRVRVTLREPAVSPPPGSAVRVVAMIGPPPAPASPGAYDFARDAWFDRVGGVGFALGEPRETVLDRAPWRLKLTMAVNAARWGLAERIVARMGESSGGLGAAMVTGHEAWIAPEVTADMRASGLAHIISISGLHMAIVGGFAFALVRLLIALLPWLAVRVSGKKVAAAGLVAVGTYLVISGAPPPAERAAITAAVAFAAILADRQAVSLRTLAVAALIILAIQPEAAVAPGFQMSFAATTALVALAEAWPRTVKEISAPWWIRWPQGAVVWLLAAVAASFVAGLATGPFALQHFNRVASYGLVANLVVSPLSSFVIMPFLALGAALEPLGLGGPFLWVAGRGIDAMTAVAHATAVQPGAQLTVASAPAIALPLAFLGVMQLCLWKGRLRWLGAPLAAAVLVWPRPTPPDVWIAADGAAMAVRQGRQAVLLRPEARRFAADLWARRRGLAVADDPEPPRDALFTCDRFACLPKTAPDVALWNGKKAPKLSEFDELCAPGRLVVLRSDAPWRGCEEAFLLTAPDFAVGGSAELWRTENGWRVRWANDVRGVRPWTR